MGGTNKHEYSGSSGPNPTNKQKSLITDGSYTKGTRAYPRRELILITLGKVHRVIKLTFIAYTTSAVYAIKGQPDRVGH